MSRLLTTIAALFLLLPPPASAQQDATRGLTKADRVGIRKVIKAQLAAFQHDNGARAFSYASPMMRQQFGSAENFLDMVRTAYPAIYRSRDVQFRALDATEDGPVQEVFFFGRDGNPVLGFYLMQQQFDGSWKINGCTLAPAPDVGI